MSDVERDGDGFIVSAALLAEAFGRPVSDIRERMSRGEILTRCETGTDEEAGRWRLSFYHAERVLRLTVDGVGTILTRSSFAAPRPRRGGP